MSFRALLTDRTADGMEHEIVVLPDDVLPEAGVIVDVEWSSLNYKDGLVLTGGGRLGRDYPHVGGVDLAGVVERSDDERWSPGDRVVLTGWRVGEIWWGGYASRASVRADWLTALPAGLTTRQAMAVGTAGFTAMLAIDTLERHGLVPGDGPVLVTGASGGLGGSAVQLLAQLGYDVAASTGRVEANGEALRTLGATTVIDRSTIEDAPGRPLLSERWAGCVDAVGGSTLAHVIAELRYGAAAAACGLAGGDAMPSNVTPFLLRGVTVFGIDSVMCPPDRRTAIWQRIEDTFDLDALESLTTEIDLDEVASLAPEILGGRTRGRTVVRIA